MRFDAVKNEVGLIRFVMTPTKWITQMNAVVELCQEKLMFMEC